MMLPLTALSWIRFVLRCKCLRRYGGVSRARRVDPWNERSENILRGGFRLLFALFLRRISSSGESRLKFLACTPLARASGVRGEGQTGNRSLVLHYCYTGRLRQTTADRCKLLKRTAYRGSYSEKRSENGERPFIFVDIFRARVCFAMNRRCLGEYIFRRNCCTCRFTDCSSLFTSFNFASPSSLIAARIQSRESFNPFTPVLCPGRVKKKREEKHRANKMQFQINDQHERRFSLTCICDRRFILISSSCIFPIAFHRFLTKNSDGCYARDFFTNILDKRVAKFADEEWLLHAKLNLCGRKGKKTRKTGNRLERKDRRNREWGIGARERKRKEKKPLLMFVPAHAESEIAWLGNDNQQRNI